MGPQKCYDRTIATNLENSCFRGAERVLIGTIEAENDAGTGRKVVQSESGISNTIA